MAGTAHRDRPSRRRGRHRAPPSGKGRSPLEKPRPLELPVRDDRQLARVRQYLTRRRGLSASLLDPLLASGKLYADRRGNAVFLLMAGKAQYPVGAELRGTGPQAWRGMAPGTRKNLGYFWIGVQGCREIVLCESAIDAISCLQLHPERICISTSGVRANPPWLRGLIARGDTLLCGFDADAPADTAAAHMLALYPAVPAPTARCSRLQRHDHLPPVAAQPYLPSAATAAPLTNRHSSPRCEPMEQSI